MKLLKTKKKKNKIELLKLNASIDYWSTETNNSITTEILKLTIAWITEVLEGSVIFQFPFCSMEKKAWGFSPLLLPVSPPPQ